MAHNNASLAIVTCIKNEGEDLAEWLYFHRQVGVSRFIIYDNISTDATTRILNAVPFKGEIVVRRIAKEAPQRAAFLDALKRYRRSLDWVAFIDGDEFLVPLTEQSLPQKLEELEAAGFDGFGVHWRIFGSGGHTIRPAGLLTESFTRRAPDDFKANRHVKSIVRIPRATAMVTQHYFRVSGRYLLDDGSEPPADFKGVSPSAAFQQGFAIHHYITKSREQCLKKIARGRPKPDWSNKKYRPLSYWNNYDRNEVEDNRAAEIVAPIRNEILAMRNRIGRD